MKAEFLLAATLAVTAAIALVLALRLPLRRRLGAVAAYALWATVPLAGLAALLPTAGTGISLPSVVALPLAGAIAPATAAVAKGATPLPWLACWAAGCLAMLALQAAQQWRFLRRRRGSGRRGVLQFGAAGPCVSGFWRPAILLPMDFRARYDRRERRLVLAHEIAHLRHGDLAINALAALLRAVFWFNPVLHWASRRFRQDQELACDARVLTRFPEARRCYAGAMLKTQLGGAASMEGPGPLGCGWFAPHSLKERIAMLHHPVPAIRRRRFGLALVVAVALAASGLAWAVKPGSPAAADTTAADAAYVDAQFTLRIGDGAEQRFRMINRFGQSFLATVSSQDDHYEAHLIANAADAGSIRLHTEVRRNGATVAKPELLLRDGEQGGLVVDAAPGQPALKLDVVLRRSATPTPQALARR